MHDERSAAPHAVGRLSLWDTVSVIVGIVIGAGIYETPPLILQNVSGPGAALAAWAMGGLLSFNGALTYAELASAYPHRAVITCTSRVPTGPRWAFYLAGHN